MDGCPPGETLWRAHPPQALKLTNRYSTHVSEVWLCPASTLQGCIQTLALLTVALNNTLTSHVQAPCSSTRTPPPPSGCKAFTGQTPKPLPAASLVIGVSVVPNIISTATHCFPGARVLDLVAQIPITLEQTSSRQKCCHPH